MSATDLYRPRHPVRFVTSAALFDGHDASINIMRRLLQAQGAEVIHLGHNRSVDEVATAAVQEDVQAVAVTSYQGGHLEYFRYLIDRLRADGRGDIKVFGGGGGVIVPAEITELEAYGAAHIFSPEDGAHLGLARMVNTMIEAADFDLVAGGGLGVEDSVVAGGQALLDEIRSGDQRALARLITVLQAGAAHPDFLQVLRADAARRRAPTLGITGTGGSGKSSLTDELVGRFRLDQEDKLRLAVLAIDPSRRRGGGALLGDRIRMNAIDSPRIFFRSLATRAALTEVPAALGDIIAACRVAGYDLVIVETPGIGQGDAGIVDNSDLSLYVMTPEFGASSQLEKIDMLDFADAVAINKFDRRGGADALRDVRRQLRRSRPELGDDPESLPVFGTVASHFHDDGVNALYQSLRDELAGRGLAIHSGTLAPATTKVSTGASAIVPAKRVRYLAEIADTVRAYRDATDEQASSARLVQRLRSVRDHLASAGLDGGRLDEALADAEAALAPAAAALLAKWPETAAAYAGDDFVTTVGGHQVHIPLYRETLAGTRVPRIVLPRLSDHGDLLRWLRRENLPGHFPYTAGVFALKRDGESPTRMFAGEGDAFRTNRRFHLLADGQSAIRLSTAFDSVTLYGFDPDVRPDIYGKVGNSGVSIATVDDMAVLFDGFDLCDAATSVSMTINGPAPTILAMFLNTAIDQRLAKLASELGREPTDSERAAATASVLGRVRGTVQADILKEDQGQNTCIFSTEFSLGVMADMEQWFIDHSVRNFYSASISGYHIAEAGANPISQLAFTLANGFTYVEAYLARGMAIDDFAPNLSFFFSNGMDAEYSVLGRVARRIWATVLRERYQAGERAQKLKYHIQTSGRSLHAQEMDFNDIRTTLQALCAIYDNCNSLHTNAYDEAVTTPSEASVRRAMAIQLIIDKEWGLTANDNPLQGSWIIEELTDLVEEAVLAEFERLDERGGVLGAMETGYQRGRIQDESMLYEQRKHDGTLPLIGVNTFVAPSSVVGPTTVELARSSEVEKQRQLARLHDFWSRHQAESPAALERLRRAALAGDNVFGVLMDVVRVCSLGEITDALFEVGGRYRRNV